MSHLLERPVAELAGVGPVRERQLLAAGVSRIGHLLAHLPSRYEDRSRTVSISELSSGSLPEEPVSVEGELSGVRTVPLRRRNLRMVQGRLVSGDGTLRVVWFNQPYLARQIQRDQRYRLYGPLRAGRSGIEMVNPRVEKVEAGQPPERGLIPVYGRLGEVGPAQAAKLVGRAVDALEAEEIAETLPAHLAAKHGLPSLRESLLALHRPRPGATTTTLEAPESPFRARLAYGELLKQQLALMRRRARQRDTARRVDYRVDEATLDGVRSLLPFEPTGAQTRVFEDIVADLSRATPMWRLVQGDVGCGKTAVALQALSLAVESGLQAAFMAPTELLAEQQARSLGSHTAGRYRLRLLTSGSPRASAIRSDIAKGAIDIVVGTHALIQETVRFRHLGLVVIDEQHRFGVSQREQLVAKGDGVDLLVMTATPIPRSLALTLYGDLDVSVIDELPPGRLPVATRVVSDDQRGQVLEEIASEVTSGGQVFYVVPLIEPSEEVTGQSIETALGTIRSALPGIAVGVVHGRLDREERDEVMRRFREGELGLLLATTVVEVGVDVPNASLMVIDGAERFGLSQLHQLRGRVGRGGRGSRCIAICSGGGEQALERLQVFERETDGFALSEADLERRGPGDVLGTRQSGQPWFRFAHPVRDVAWLARAREDARELVAAEAAEEG